MSEQQIFANYYLKLKDLIDLILITPIFTILSYILLKRVLDNLSNSDIAKNKITISYFVYLIAIILFAYGNMIHITMNRLNSSIPDINHTEQYYYTIYYLDEMWGHHLIELGFFIVFTEITLLHTLNLSKSKELSKSLMNRMEKSWNSIFGIVLGIATSLAYLEGQSAFLFLILNPIFCVLLIYYNQKSHINLKENSLLMLFILMTIAFTITTLLWGAFTGIKPAYPFFYQNSEL